VKLTVSMYRHVHVAGTWETEGSFSNTWLIFIALSAMQWEGRGIICYWSSHAIPRQIHLSLILGRVWAYHQNTVGGWLLRKWVNRCFFWSFLLYISLYIS